MSLSELQDRLLSVPDDTLPAPAHLPLQLQHAVQQGLCCGWAAGNVQVNGHDTITTSYDRV